MKANELREMQTAELTSKLADLKAELFNLRFQHAINQLENPGRIGVKVWVYKGEVLKSAKNAQKKEGGNK